MSSTEVRKRRLAKKKPEQSRQHKGVYEAVILQPERRQRFKWKKYLYVAAIVIVVLAIVLLAVAIYLTIAWHYSFFPFSSPATNTTSNLILKENELSVASIFNPLDSKNSSMIEKLFPKSLTKIDEHHLREFPHISGIVLTNGDIEDLGCRGTLVNCKYSHF